MDTLGCRCQDGIFSLQYVLYSIDVNPGQKSENASLGILNLANLFLCTTVAEVVSESVLISKYFK